jgi:hypothetical protein
VIQPGPLSHTPRVRAAFRWLSAVALVALLMASVPPAAPRVSAAATGEADPVRLVVEDASGVQLDISVSRFEAVPVTAADGGRYVRLSARGLLSNARPGQPDVPARGVLIAVPPGAQLSVETGVLEEETVQLAAAVEPVPAAASPDEGSPAVYQPPAADSAAADTVAGESRAPAQLEDAGYFRDVRLARLTVYPLRYDPVTRMLRHIRRMQVRVRFNAAASLDTVPAAAGPALEPDTGDFLAMTRKAVINPDFPATWRAAPRAPVAAGALTSVFAPLLQQTRNRIIIDQTGVYRLTYADLLAGQAPVATLDPRTLRVFQAESELAIEVRGEADGRFDPGDEILFYAENTDSLYRATTTLWLAFGAGPGRRVTARSAALGLTTPDASFRASLPFEQDKFYRSSMPMASEVDHWYWGQMYIISTTHVPTVTVPITIEHPLTTGLARLTVDMWGGSSDPRVMPDHRVFAYVNGTKVGEATWDGAILAQPVFTFDQGVLRPGANTVSLYTPGDTGGRDALNRLWETNWLNALRVDYDRAYRASGNRLIFTPAEGKHEIAIDGWTDGQVLAYDVSSAATAVRLDDLSVTGSGGAYTTWLNDTAPRGARYIAVARSALLSPLSITPDAPSDVYNSAKAVDYLIISHGDFIAGLGPLVTLRESDKLSVRVVDVQDIYDEFSYGELDPHAIRDFIQNAYYNWPRPAPTYVLLVGDGSYDFMDREGYGAQNYVPPFLASVDPVLGETAADNRYVTVVGNDPMPDLHLGRLPVNNAAELAAMVDKIVTYQANPPAGDWSTRAVFVADNPDSAGQFGALSDLAVAFIPPELSVEKIYLGTADYPSNQAVLAQQATLDAFNAGALLFNYVGHSSISNWAAELLFGTNALAQINNGPKYPIVLPMTCLEGTYHNARFVGVAESLVRLAGRGAVASWSPTGLGVASGHDYLHRGFYDALFNWDVHELGPATTAAKLNLYTQALFPDGTPRFRDLLDTYMLLGDPATRVNLPQADLTVAASIPAQPLGPGDTVTITLTYGNQGAARVKDVTIIAELPDVLSDLAWTASNPALAAQPGSPFTWTLAGLPPVTSEQITLTATLPTAVEAADLPLQVTAAISSRASESNHVNNQAGPVAISLAPADLVLVQSVDPATPMLPGERLTFTLGYANLGPSAASGVRLALPLPVALDELQVTTAGTTATPEPGSQYTWALSRVAAGSKGRVMVSGRVPISLTVDQLLWTVAAEITAAWPDADPSTNKSDPATVIVRAGDLFEPDNTQTNALLLTVPALSQPHTFDPIGDQDWFAFDAEAGVTYIIETVSVTVPGDTVMFLWREDGKLLAKNDDYAPDSRLSRITWTPSQAGRLCISVTSSSVIPGFNYGLKITPLRNHSHLPAMFLYK